MCKTNVYETHYSVPKHLKELLKMNFMKCI